MPRPRPTHFALLALLGAVTFLLVRVGYRIVFGGAGGGETLLWSLPTARLWGPFSHVVVGGDITAEGLSSSLIHGIPFATVILVSGLALAFVDPRSLVLLVPKLRHGKSVVLAFVIALSTLPFLVTTMRSTRAHALRRGVTSRRALILPILEKTLERSVGIADALQSRGIVVSPEGPPTLLESVRPIVFSQFSVPSRGITTVSWQVEPGSRVVLTGPTGSGKTTLLAALAGRLFTDGTGVTTGSVHPGCDPARVAYVPHQPHTLFLAGSVVDDIALSFVCGGASRKESRARALVALEDWELSHLGPQHPSSLSTGEAVLVALLAVFVTQPRVLVVDEPLHNLDPRWRRVVVERLATLQDTDVTVVVSDHGNPEIDAWGADYFTVTPDGVVPGRYVAPLVHAPPRSVFRRPEPEIVATFEDISLEYGGAHILTEARLVLGRGEITMISGENGSGKTSFLEECAKAQPLPAKFALVPAHPWDMFLCDSLARELRGADKAAGVEPGFTRTTLEAILQPSWRSEIFANIEHTHPRDLSRGQQTAVAIAIQLSHKPEVLALDEPTSGLDQAATEALVEVLACVQETGVAIVIATHDQKTFADFSDHTLILSNGTLRTQSAVVT